MTEFANRGEGDSPINLNAQLYELYGFLPDASNLHLNDLDVETPSIFQDSGLTIYLSTGEPVSLSQVADTMNIFRGAYEERWRRRSQSPVKDILLNKLKSLLGKAHATAFFQNCLLIDLEKMFVMGRARNEEGKLIFHPTELPSILSFQTGGIFDSVQAQEIEKNAFNRERFTLPFLLQNTSSSQFQAEIGRATSLGAKVTDLNIWRFDYREKYGEYPPLV